MCITVWVISMIVGVLARRHTPSPSVSLTSELLGWKAWGVQQGSLTLAPHPPAMAPERAVQQGEPAGVPDPASWGPGRQRCLSPCCTRSVPHLAAVPRKSCLVRSCALAPPSPGPGPNRAFGGAPQRLALLQDESRGRLSARSPGRRPGERTGASSAPDSLLTPSFLGAHGLGTPRVCGRLVGARGGGNARQVSAHRGSERAWRKRRLAPAGAQVPPVLPPAPSALDTDLAGCSWSPHFLLPLALRSKGLEAPAHLRSPARP